MSETPRRFVFALLLGYAAPASAHGPTGALAFLLIGAVLLMALLCSYPTFYFMFRERNVGMSAISATVLCVGLGVAYVQLQPGYLSVFQFSVVGAVQYSLYGIYRLLKR